MRNSSKGFKPARTPSHNRNAEKQSTGVPIKSDSRIVSKKTVSIQKHRIGPSQQEEKVPNVKQIGLPKCPPRKDEKPARIYQRKHESVKDPKWGFLPYSCLATIFSFTCARPFEVYLLSKVCSTWRSHLASEGGCYLWNHIEGTENIAKFQEFKLYLQKLIVGEQQKMSFEFEKIFIKLFNYGSTKQNIPNKLIEKLNLEIEVTLNKKVFMQPFKLRTFNFSSYLCCKIEQIRDYKYDFSTPHNMFKDHITLDMNFRSRKYRVSHKISKKYVPEDIVEGAINQKAFNYYLDKNFVFTFFQGDDHFLYVFFEMSVLELVNTFRSIIKCKHQQSLDKKKKKLPLYKQLCQTQFEDFVQYVKFQADFQIHFSYHNSLKQIFTHCDTKVFPIEYDRKHAYFQVKIDDTFDKVATYKLDNKMGMSESIDDLYLVDFVLKDRDRFLIMFSGFIYARKANLKERQSLDNYLDFTENEIKIIESRQQNYQISFTIVEEKKKNLMKDVNFSLFA